MNIYIAHESISNRQFWCNPAHEKNCSETTRPPPLSAHHGSHDCIFSSLHPSHLPGDWGGCWLTGHAGGHSHVLSRQIGMLSHNLLWYPFNIMVIMHEISVFYWGLSQGPAQKRCANGFSRAKEFGKFCYRFDSTLKTRKEAQANPLLFMKVWTAPSVFYGHTSVLSCPESEGHSPLQVEQATMTSAVLTRVPPFLSARSLLDTEGTTIAVLIWHLERWLNGYRYIKIAF